MARILITGLILTVATGCASNRYLDAVNSASDRWFDAVGVRAPVDTLSIHDGFVPCGDLKRAVGCHQRGHVSLSSRLTDEQLEQVAVHELGHALGAGHVEAGCGVMGANAGSATSRITARDIRAVCGSNADGYCQRQRPE